MKGRLLRTQRAPRPAVVAPGSVGRDGSGLTDVRAPRRGVVDGVLPDQARQLASVAGNRAFAVLARAAEVSSPTTDLANQADGETIQHDGRPLGSAAPLPGVLQRQPTGLTFEPLEIQGHVKTLSPSALGNASGEIVADMTKLKEKLRNTQIAMLAGIDNFFTDQSFAGAKEAEGDYSGVFLHYAGKKILESVVDKVGEEIPFFKPIWGFTFGLMEELDKEGERAAKAKGELEVGKFIGDYRTKVANEFNKRIDDVGPAQDELITQYQTLAAANPELSTPTAPSGAAPGAQPNVAGDAAEFLTKLQTVIDGLKEPKAEDCLQKIVEEWVIESEGDIMSRGGGDMYVNGRITLAAKLYRDGEDWKVVERPEKGTLVADRADRAIKSIDSLLASGKSINDLGILKVLTIDVEDEVFGLNDHYAVNLNWRGIDDVTLESTIPSPVEADTVAKADAIGARAQKELDVKQIKIAKLEPVAGGGEKVG